MAGRKVLPDKIPIALVVNGVATQLRSHVNDLARRIARPSRPDQPQEGCDHGQCGACTVLWADGESMRTSGSPHLNDGAEVTNFEGLAAHGALHPLQQAFIDHDAFHRGCCTPGQICSAAGLIAEGKAQNAETAKLIAGGSNLIDLMNGMSNAHEAHRHHAVAAQHCHRLDCGRANWCRMASARPANPRGAAEPAFTAAEVRHEGEYYVPIEYHNPISFRACLAGYRPV
jgi:xanthine dehydrogenase YagT iron-sulfur-binding subunit